MPAGDLGVRSCIRTGGSKAPKKYWMTNQTPAKTIAVVVTATNRRHSLNGPMSCDTRFFQTLREVVYFPFAFSPSSTRRTAVACAGLAIAGNQSLDMLRTAAMFRVVVATRSAASCSSSRFLGSLFDQ